MAATLQVLSGGRFILGIGAGWRAKEYLAYGYEFPRPPVRFAQLEEVIRICRLMWTEDDPSFEGTYFSIQGAAAPPKPDPIPPICIGASGERVGLPLAGRLADIWNGTSRGTDDDWRRRVDIVMSAASAAGRDPAEIQVSTTIERALPTDDAGSDEWRALLEHRYALGVRHFVLDFGKPQDTEPVLRFAEQVLAPMRAAHP